MEPTYHTTQVFVAVQSGEVLLLATVERRVRQIDLGGEVVVKVLIVPNRIVLLGCVHNLQIGIECHSTELNFLI